jgi:KDO2-lipid IV(A) lauroyltransferase
VYQAPPFSLALLHPRYWLLWLALGLAYLISWLPYSWLMALGRGLGRLSFKLLKSRSRIAKRNLELCFPDMSAIVRDELLQRNAEETGCAALETLIGWWWPAWRVRQIAHFNGYEHIQAELAQGKGVLLLAPHMLHLEVAGRVFGQTHPSIGFYRPHNNALMEFFMYRGRSRGNKYMIGKRDVKALLRALNDGEVCFYLPDQDYGRNRALFAPFFAVPDTATTTGTLLFAKSANCAVVPIYTSKLPNNQGYQIEALPALTDFPGTDEYAAICRVNQWVEQAILKHPEQYMWVHRRFKTRPDPDGPSLY